MCFIFFWIFETDILSLGPYKYFSMELQNKDILFKSPRTVINIRKCNTDTTVRLFNPQIQISRLTSITSFIVMFSPHIGSHPGLCNGLSHVTETLGKEGIWSALPFPCLQLADWGSGMEGWAGNQGEAGAQSRDRNSGIRWILVQIFVSHSVTVTLGNCDPEAVWASVVSWGKWN